MTFVDRYHVVSSLLFNAGVAALFLNEYNTCIARDCWFPNWNLYGMASVYLMVVFVTLATIGVSALRGGESHD